MYVKFKGESFFGVKYLKERERVMSFMYCYSSLVVDTMIRLCKQSNQLCVLQEDSEGEDFDPVDGENEDEEEGMYLSVILGNLLFCIVAYFV